MNNILPIETLNVQRPFSLEELGRIDRVNQIETISKNHYVEEYEKYHSDIEEVLLNIDVYFIYNEIITILNAAINKTLFH